MLQFLKAIGALIIGVILVGLLVGAIMAGMAMTPIIILIGIGLFVVFILYVLISEAQQEKETDDKKKPH